jgi:phytoene dehydrogenase-like protein
MHFFISNNQFCKLKFGPNINLKIPYLPKLQARFRFEQCLLTFEHSLHPQFFELTKSNFLYDAVVIGSGPNGLAAGIRLAQFGLRVKIYEAHHQIGGGTRTDEHILPGYKHDICSAIHPVGVSSPFLKTLPLKEYGLEWIHPEICAAHPLDHQPPAILTRDQKKTAFYLKEDEEKYLSIVQPIINNWEQLTGDFLGPLTVPSHPFKLAQFGVRALLPSSIFQRSFKSQQAKALIAGMAAHSVLPLNSWTTTAIALVFFGAAHTNGWPIAKGGSHSITKAMESYLLALGGEIETNHTIHDLNQLPSSKAVLFDTSPSQALDIAGDTFPATYQKKLRSYRHAPGVFKVDYILSEPVPWKDEECKKAGTVHVGGTFDEISESEKQMDQNKHSDKPFVLVAQQSLFDTTRTPDEKEVLWAYCHVPNGSNKDMTEEIENQIERFAPGFKDTILHKSVMNTKDFEQYNQNYIGGDISGGRQDITQLFSRPVHVFDPYSTPVSGIYFCSSSTPPGGGVHGMCGYHAANSVLKNEFDIKAPIAPANIKVDS